MAGQTTNYGRHKDKDGNIITKTQDALVPKLYLRSANIATGALTPDGRYAAMSGKNMDLQLTGNLDSNGNVIAKGTMSIKANNVTNDGGIMVTLSLSQQIIPLPIMAPCMQTVP
ncbi:hypothetical protein [Moraxella ovis]|uniref:hypothetical protein n=1 Tax=Moraxella ovis TaxID=29433 RepID=UPI000D951DF1|nr:hypothetical protein [Moraxella ovis]SPX85207.1 Uncharacterised protein [Moraxella ovis]